MTTKYGVTPEEVLTHQHKLGSSDWSAWFLIWRYADERGLMTKQLNSGTDRAERQRPVTDAHLKATVPVIDHAIRAIRERA